MWTWNDVPSILNSVVKLNNRNKFDFGKTSTFHLNFQSRTLPNCCARSKLDFLFTCGDASHDDLRVTSQSLSANCCGGGGGVFTRPSRSSTLPSAPSLALPWGLDDVSRFLSLSPSALGSSPNMSSSSSTSLFFAGGSSVFSASLNESRRSGWGGETTSSRTVTSL